MAATVTTEAKLAKTREQINLLLAKAESTNFPAEAELAQKRAETLMVRYGIDMAQLDAEKGNSGREREEMVERRVVIGTRYRAGLVEGIDEVIRSFQTIQPMQSTNHRKNETTMYLIGAKSDVEQVMRMIDSLLAQVQIAVTSWWLTYDAAAKSVMTRAEKQTDKREFQMAFLKTVARRLRAIYGEAKSDSVGTELVLVNRRERATEYGNELYPNAREIRTRGLNSGSAGAFMAGRAAGQRASVDSGSVAGSARKPVNA